MKIGNGIQMIGFYYLYQLTKKDKLEKLNGCMKTL